MLLFIITESIQAKEREPRTYKSFFSDVFLRKKYVYTIENADENEEGSSLQIPAV